VVSPKYGTCCQPADSVYYTLSLKTRIFVSRHNSGSCVPIFKIFTLKYFQGGFSVCSSKFFHRTWDMLLRSPVEIENSKVLAILIPSAANCCHVPRYSIMTLTNVN